jgi:hypothetical protein
MIHPTGRSAVPRTFRLPVSIAFALAMPLILLAPGWATAGTITFSLGDPVFEGSLAKFDVRLDFTGGLDDQIEAIQLSVLGSDPNLRTDLDRFSFDLDSNFPFDSWLNSGTVGSTGVELLFPFPPGVGPFVAPGTRQLGVLSVDLAGLPAGAATNVSLNAPLSEIPTDVGGTFGDNELDSVLTATSGASFLEFSEPLGVTFNNPIPEPNSLLVFVALAVTIAGCNRRRRLSRRLD